MCKKCKEQANNKNNTLITIGHPWHSDTFYFQQYGRSNRFIGNIIKDKYNYIV